MPYKPPFTLVAGQGLGISYSSLTQIGPIQGSESFGQAHIQVYANVTSGNVIVRDHRITIMEVNEPLEFSYIYNSQTKGNIPHWREPTDGAAWSRTRYDRVSDRT